MGSPLGSLWGLVIIVCRHDGPCLDVADHLFTDVADLCKPEMRALWIRRGAFCILVHECPGDAARILIVHSGAKLGPTPDKLSRASPAKYAPLKMAVAHGATAIRGCFQRPLSSRLGGATAIRRADPRLPGPHFALGP